MQDPGQAKADAYLDAMRRDIRSREIEVEAIPNRRDRRRAKAKLDREKRRLARKAAPIKRRIKAIAKEMRNGDDQNAQHQAGIA